jgi:hypothetical protein
MEDSLIGKQIIGWDTCVVNLADMNEIVDYGECQPRPSRTDLTIH